MVIPAQSCTHLFGGPQKSFFLPAVALKQKPRHYSTLQGTQDTMRHGLQVHCGGGATCPILDRKSQPRQDVEG